MTPPPIRSFEHVAALDRKAPVVTLYSGGLDSTYLLLRLKELGFTEVHAMSVGLGADESVDRAEKHCATLGAHLHHVNRTAEFCADHIAPAIQAQAIYLGMYPVSSSLSRPLIAHTAVEVAERLGALAVLHTANRSQNTLRRLNGALRLLGFPGRYGSPYDLGAVSRAEKMRALEAAGVDQLADRATSGDANLWAREFESGVLDDPERHEVPEELYHWSVPHADVEPIRLSVEFQGGLPRALDGVELPLVEMVALLNHRVGRYGLGRYSGLEHLDHGEKVMEFREMPAAWLLLSSYQQLEAACVDAETIREKRHVEQVWVREALEGRWFGVLRRAADGFIRACAQDVTGKVEWSLDLGASGTRSIIADRPLYLRDRERWESRSIATECADFDPHRAPASY